MTTHRTEPDARPSATRSRRVVALAVLTALLYVAMVAHTWSIEPSVPALQLTFTESGFRQVLAQWSVADLERFRTHFLIDYPFLLCYGLLGFELGTRTAVFGRWSDRSRTRIALALPIAAGADVIENLIHFSLLNASSSLPQAVYLVSGIAATIKWSLVAGFILALVVTLFQRKGSAPD